MNAHVIVERTPWPRDQLRVAVRITGPNFEAVQSAISDIQFEDATESSTFGLPRFDGLCWSARGDVRLREKVS